jgi:riboflavin transporter FmnP
MSKTYRLVATATLAALAFVLQFANGALGLQTGFGMTIDLVAVPIILALFMFGVESSIEVLAVSTIFIALFAQTGPIGAAMKFAATAPTIAVFAAYLIMRGKGTGAPAIALAALAAIVFSVGLFAAGGIMHSTTGSAGLLFGLLPILIMLLITYLVLKYFERERRIKDAMHKPSAFTDMRVLALLVVAVIIIRGAAMVVSNFYFAGPLYFKISPEEFVSYVNSSDLLFFGKGAAWYAAIFAFNAIQAAIEIGVAWLIAYRFGFAKKYSS